MPKLEVEDVMRTRTDARLVWTREIWREVAETGRRDKDREAGRRTGVKDRSVYLLCSNLGHYVRRRFGEFKPCRVYTHKGGQVLHA